MIKTLPILSLIVLLGCNSLAPAQNSIESEDNVNLAMLSLRYYYCLEKNINAGDLLETHISTLKETARKNNLKEFKVEDKVMDIYKQDSCFMTTIQLSASFRYNSKKVNNLHQELNNEDTNEWDFSLVLYEEY